MISIICRIARWLSACLADNTAGWEGRAAFRFAGKWAEQINGILPGRHTAAPEEAAGGEDVKKRAGWIKRILGTLKRVPAGEKDRPGAHTATDETIRAIQRSFMKGARENAHPRSGA